MYSRKAILDLFGKWVTLAVVFALIAAVPAVAATGKAQPKDDDSPHREARSQPAPMAGPESSQDEKSPSDVQDERRRTRDRRDAPRRHRRGIVRRRGEAPPRSNHRAGKKELQYRPPHAPFDRDRLFRRGDDRSAPREFTPEEIDRAMHVLRMELPVWYGRLAEMREYAPDRFARAVRKFLPMTLEYLSMRETDPRLADTIIEEFKIEGELRELSHRYHNPSINPAEREEMDVRIDRLVHEQFEMRMLRRAARIHKLELRLRQQMERMQTEQRRFQKDQERVEELITRRIEQIKRGALREPALQSREHRRDRAAPPGPRREKHRGRRTRGR